MRSMLAESVRTHLVLEAETAEDLMEPNPISIRDEATVKEAIGLFTDKGYSAAPVINEAGQPVGVVSRADILVHERERIHVPSETPDVLEPARVRDIMTPAVFAVTPDTSAVKVIEEMIAMQVHQLFVQGRDGILVGVIRALDIINHLHTPP